MTTPSDSELHSQAALCAVAETVNMLTGSLSSTQQTRMANALLKVRANCRLIGACTTRDTILAGDGP